MTKKINSERCIVSFLDILGYSQWVKTPPEDAKKALLRHFESFDEAIKAPNNPYQPVFAHISLHSLSDSLIVVLPDIDKLPILFPGVSQEANNLAFIETYFLIVSWHFKLDKSNFKQWQKLASDSKSEQIEKQLQMHIDHIDKGAKPEDLLYEILIKAGFVPTEKVKTIQLVGIDVFSIAEGALLICLAKVVTKELINAVAEVEPMQFICLDSAFGDNDQLKANAVQTFTARNMGRDKANQIVFRTV